MFTAKEILDSLSERMHASAHVRNVFGDPIAAGDRTIIPVARLGYGLGAGTGGDDKRGGGGGGGGVGAMPVGVVEITSAGTRFISLHDTRRLAIAATAGFLFGAFLARRRARHS
jgi:uncharacterized spore protein YtfJ